jgi:hypothetical protein
MPEAIKRTRIVKPKPGMKKLTVYLTEAHHAKLETHAKSEGGICPRPANETLSNLIHKHFATLVPDATS